MTDTLIYCRKRYNDAREVCRYVHRHEFGEQTKNIVHTELTKCEDRLKAEVQRLSRTVWPMTGRPVGVQNDQA